MAIKLLRSDRNSPDALAKFEREVQLTSELSHPNVVVIYDYGRSPGGQFYCVMELLDGIDLGTLIAEDGPQPAARVIHILRQVCGALRAAHERGLTHRDIKPGNIILCKRLGTPDVAKVVDFGLVMEVDAVNASQPNTIAGTPLYMSPEAIESPGDVGPQSDLYALGAVGFFLLTGRHVFQGESVAEVCMKQLSETPRRPSETATAPVPPELDDLILKCLSKSPADRPASAETMADALAMVPGAQDWQEARARDWWQESKRAMPRRADPDKPPSVESLTIDLHTRQW